MTPSRFQIAQGVREGQSAGGGIIIRRYLPGAEFAREYVMRVVSSVCTNVAVVGQKPRPDLAQGPWARRLAVQGDTTCYSSISVSFPRRSRNARAARG
jgi:hypothetical protein